MVDKHKRVLSAVVLVILILFFVLSGGIIFKIGVLGITGIALYEYIKVYDHTNSRAITWVLAAGFAADVFVLYFNSMEYILPIIYLVVLCSMAVPIFTKKYNVMSSAVTVIGYIYIINFFSLLVFIREHSAGDRLIWLIFIISWFSDTCAYYIGRKLGKRKLCPDVSPKKTIEGSIGGILGSIGGVLIWSYFISNTNIAWYQIVLLGVAAGIISQIGDLSASLIKRFIGVKDYGKIMPGHGGILDRFDSILFTAPIVYYYIKIFIGW